MSVPAASAPLPSPTFPPPPPLLLARLRVPSPPALAASPPASTVHTSLSHLLKRSYVYAHRTRRCSLILACYILVLVGASYHLHNTFGGGTGSASAPARPHAGSSDAQGALGRIRHPIPQPEPPQPSFPQHEFRHDGLLGVNPEGRHPIFDLIERAEREWERKLSRASKSLDEAAAEYRRRYGRMPPKGFDQWWDYVERHNVRLPDEYDQITRDIEPFWAMRPQDLRQMELELEGQMDSFTIGKTGKHPLGLVNATLAVENHLNIARGMLNTMKLVEALLPPFRAVFSPHDNPSNILSYEWLMLAREHIKAGTYLDISDPKYEKLGWLSACAPSSPARTTPLYVNQPPPPPRGQMFIYDHVASMDPCMHPRHLHIHGQYLPHPEAALPLVPFAPKFSFSTSPMYYDIRTATPFSWVEDVPGDPEWEERGETRLLWRGRNTGIWYSPTTPWQQTQRIRLVAKAQEKAGAVDVLLAGGPDQRVASREMLVRWLNEQLLDFAFVDEPLACEQGTCEELKQMFHFVQPMDLQTAGNYKYVMDVDGNGWSSRFKRLITTRALVFKATAYPEWFADRITPWVHYVPVQLDYSDLYDALVFFRGDMNGDGAHDAMAKKIALAGREWSKAFWRKEDVTAYNFRLMLEYARIMSIDRDAMSYVHP